MVGGFALLLVLLLLRHPEAGNLAVLLLHRPETGNLQFRRGVAQTSSALAGKGAVPRYQPRPDDVFLTGFGSLSYGRWRLVR